jgi:hypothetical protein
MKTLLAMLLVVSSACAASPRFEEFPVTPSQIEKMAPTSIPTTGIDWKMEEYLRYADEKSEQRLDFADRYTVFHIGCGTGCHQYALIDRITGAVFSGGCHQEDFPPDYAGPMGFEYRRTSRLLIIRRSESFRWPVFVDYFVWDGKVMSLLLTERKDGPNQTLQRTPDTAPVAPAESDSRRR